MIGFVRGRLAQKEPPWLVVDVNGVGYEIEAPMSTSFACPTSALKCCCARTSSCARTSRRCSAFTEEERRLFRNLIKVSGVGAKLALTILSGISVDGFVQCVQAEDKAALVRLPGIGRKTAERLILDMRDRIDASSAATSIGAAGGGEPSSSRVDAFNALVTLGYKPAEVQKMLDRVDTDGQNTEEILRSVLRAAAP